MNRELIKGLLPPILIRSLKRSGVFNYGVTWKGNYSSWQQAAANSIGYDSAEILEKVKQSLLKVKKGEAAYERDSVVFSEPDYDWPTLGFLMWIYSRNKQLNLIDFGGSLGSSYYQNRFFLKDLPNVRWNVIEQPHFVECGKENFEAEQLKFFYDIESCVATNPVNLVILSSVLPYVEDPYGLLHKLMNLDVQFMLIDKMPLIEAASDRITVQHVPETIYKASYPAWFFGRERFYRTIQEHFNIVAEVDREIEANLPAVFKGLLLERK